MITKNYKLVLNILCVTWSSDTGKINLHIWKNRDWTPEQKRKI